MPCVGIPALFELLEAVPRGCSLHKWPAAGFQQVLIPFVGILTASTAVPDRVLVLPGNVPYDMRRIQPVGHVRGLTLWWFWYWDALEQFCGAESCAVAFIATVKLALFGPLPRVFASNIRFTRLWFFGRCPNSNVYGLVVLRPVAE